MSGQTARKLKLHRAADEEPISQGIGERKPYGVFWIAVRILAVGALVGAVSQVYFSSLRYYRAESRIVLRGLDEERLPLAIRRHLSALQSANLSTGSGREAATIQELMRQDRLVIYPSDRQTISLVVRGKEHGEVSRMADDLAAGYVAGVNGGQAAETKAKGIREKAIEQYRQLQARHQQLQEEIRQAVKGLPRGQIETVIDTVAKNTQSRIKETEARVALLDVINRDISRLRDELVHPALKVDPERWNAVKFSDRQYSGDWNMLRARHGDYVSNLRGDMKGLTESLGQLDELLKSISTRVTGQLQVKLPEDLSDDLLEMNLAVEKYEGQVVHFQDRWQRYQAKLEELFADPAASDFDGIGTLLSQLRQDLMQRCSRLPTHLEGLFNQLRQGGGGSGEPGRLTNLTARNVAGSNLSPVMDQTLDAWRKVTFHLNRLFPDGNVYLMTLGRACRSLQWRLNFREKQLRQSIEQQQLAVQRRETQAKLVELQKDFERTSNGLIATYRQFSSDQKTLADAVKRWPRLQQLREAIGGTERRVAALEKELSPDGLAAKPERLELGPPIVQACSYGPIGSNWQSPMSAALAIGSMVLAFVLRRRRPSDR